MDNIGGFIAIEFIYDCMSDSIYYDTKSNSFVESDCSTCDLLLDGSERVALSKAMSYTLRHDESVPLDSNGWISIEQLLDEVSESISKQVSSKMVKGVVELSDKERYEVKNSDIRALYGHSVNVSINNDTEEFDTDLDLYHGTAVSNVTSIKENGLLPQGRDKVHLTTDFDTACETGRRHSEDIVILHIDEKKLNEEFAIKNPSGTTYTVDKVPPEYISKIESI